MADIRGQAFLGALEGIRSLHGDTGREELVRALGGELRGAIDTGAIIATGFYPLRWYSELTEAVAARWGAHANVEMARAGMRHDVTTIVRFILSLSSPALLVPLSGRIMRLYYRGAGVSVRLAGRFEAVASFSTMEGTSPHTWDAVRGALLAFIELAGGRDVEATVVAGGGVLDAAEIALTWRE